MCIRDSVVPQLGRRVLARQPADHRSEESHPCGWLEVDDGGAHVLAGQRERLVRLLPDLEVPRLIVQCVRQLERQTRVGEDWLRELAVSYTHLRAHETV